MIDLIATVVAIAGLVAAGGTAAYLFLLRNAATKRGAAGASIAADVRKRMIPVLVAVAGAVIALILTGGQTFADILAIVVGGGAGGFAAKQLSSVREDYRTH
jgi:hypothetical protein